MAAVTGAVIAGAALVGNTVAADKQRKDARRANPSQKIPQDQQNVRDTLSGIFTDEDFLLGADDELSQAVRSNQLDFLDPALREGVLSGGSALGLANEIGDAQRPVFENNLQNTFNSIMSRFGSGGLRIGASSDLNRQIATQAGNSEAQFQASLLGLVPQLQANQISGFGAFSGNANQVAAQRAQQEQARLGLATGFGTAFPGQQGFNPLLGAPGGTAAAFTGGAQALALLPQLSTLFDGFGNAGNPTTPAGTLPPAGSSVPPVGPII